MLHDSIDGLAGFVFRGAVHDAPPGAGLVFGSDARFC